MEADRMRRFARRPDVITVVFPGEGDRVPDFVLLRGAEVWNETQGSWIRVNEGDVLRIDDPDDVYPIAADYLEENFEEVEG